MVIFAVTTISVTAIFAEIVTCPHCGKSFDTASASTQKPIINNTEYEVISIKRFRAMGKNYIGKKICFEDVQLFGMSNDTIDIKDRNYDSVYYAKYNNEIAEQLLDLTESKKYVNVYGTVKSDTWGNAKFHIETVQ